MGRIITTFFSASICDNFLIPPFICELCVSLNFFLFLISQFLLPLWPRYEGYYNPFFTLAFFSPVSACCIYISVLLGICTFTFLLHGKRNILRKIFQKGKRMKFFLNGKMYSVKIRYPKLCTQRY